MSRRSAASLLFAGLLALGFTGSAGAARGHGGHFGGGGHFVAHGGHFVGHPGFHHFVGPRVFIGGGFYAPYYYPPYYSPYYYPPAPTVQYYCPALGAYYPYVQQCPGAWQPVPAY